MEFNNPLRHDVTVIFTCGHLYCTFFLMILFHIVSILNRNDVLPGSLEKELEQHKKYVAIGYNNFYADEIRMKKMKPHPTE